MRRLPCITRICSDLSRREPIERLRHRQGIDDWLPLLLLLAIGIKQKALLTRQAMVGRLFNKLLKTARLRLIETEQQILKKLELKERDAGRRGATDQTETASLA